MPVRFSIQSSLSRSRQNILRKARAFDASAERFRFEGKAHFKLNASRVARRLAAFDSALSAQVRLEEERIFPYIALRVPRFEILLYFFRTEHDEFRSQIRKLKFLLHLLGRARANALPAGALREVRAGAMRLVAHVDAHIRQEDAELFRVIDAEFHPNEKRALRRLTRASRPAPEAQKFINPRPRPNRTKIGT